jgi:hypothetical protein
MRAKGLLGTMAFLVARVKCKVLRKNWALYIALEDELT